MQYTPQFSALTVVAIESKTEATNNNKKLMAKLPAVCLLDIGKMCVRSSWWCVFARKNERETATERNN